MQKKEGMYTDKCLFNYIEEKLQKKQKISNHKMT
jgi:hypothetical protein